MIKKILFGLGIVLLVLVGVVALQPEDFRISRATTIQAPAAVVFEQVNDFHKWEAWSPWAKLDPQAKVAFDGPTAGEGAQFAWAGNQEVGEGRMTIVESRPGEVVRIRQEFLKPFEGRSETEFLFVPEGDGTKVTWTMSGKNNFVGKAISLVMDCDSMVGSQFEQGLANIKAVCESATGR